MCQQVGVVAIGRNEGERLRRCLESALAQAAEGTPVVYVDSGSSDGSIELARGLGAQVVELDLSRPFTAARARNAGLQRLLELTPEVRFVQFVDGDCEIAAGWIDRARRELEANGHLAVVAGRRRERHPEHSVYNRLCDIEWNTSIGDVRACGGDAMMRVEAFRQVGGYDDAVIAGEEPELCVRLRRAGWTIRRLDAEMTLHDAAMSRFAQWWRRAVRSGHAYAQGAAMHGRPPERHCVRQVRSVWFWGLLLPLLVLAAAWPTHGASLVALVGYPLLAGRIYRQTRGRLGGRDARLYALFCVLAKFPQALGQVRYWLSRGAGRPSRLIEYKSAAHSGSDGVCRTAAPAALPPVAWLASAFPSASETFVYREVRALRQRGWVVHALSLYPPPDPLSPDLADLAEPAAALYGHVPATCAQALCELLAHPLAAAATLAQAARDALAPGEPLPVVARAKLAPQAFAALAAARRLRRRGVRHIHCHFANTPSTVGMYAARQLGVSFSFTGHANDLFQRRVLLKRKLARAAFIACISHWHRSFHEGVEPSAAGRCVLVRCGVDMELWQPRSSEPRPPDGVPLRVLSVCRLVEKKGIDTLITALHELRRVCRDLPCQLTIAGDGIDRERLQQLAAALGCQDAIRWLGAVSNEQVRALMREADVFVVPCRTDRHGDRDGIPVALMEAMACGLPVISGDLPAIRELIEDRQGGLLLADGAGAPRLAELLAELAADTELRRRLGVAARGRVAEEFSLEANIKRLEDALGQVLSVTTTTATATGTGAARRLEGATA